MAYARPADERRRFDVLKAELKRLPAELRKLVGSVVAAHWMMAFGRREVLPHGENVDAGGAQIARDLEDFVFSFAQSKHEARFGEHAGFVRPAQKHK